MSKLNMETYSVESNKKVTGKFINRELSWLSFNARVLYYALSKRIPLNNRFNFLAITESNLDEFISVRFAGEYNSNDSSKIYKNILNDILKFKESQEKTFNILKKQIKEDRNIEFVKVKELNNKDKNWLYDYYKSQVFPLLTPVIINNDNYSPNLVSGQSCIAVSIQKGNYEVLCVIPISTDINPFITIGKKIVLIEDAIKEYASKTLFINEQINDMCVFRLIKDASIILSHDGNRFIVDRMNDVISGRKNASPIFMEIEKKASEKFENILINVFKVPYRHIFHNDHIIGLKRFMTELTDKPEDSYKPFEPFVFENEENYSSIFHALDEKDILLHHPYDSYETVVKFIQHAAYDKDVVAIKQTLYRVSSINSPIVDALCHAAKNGKKVSVLIEIKARFDEENNINLIEKLKNAGATVLLGTEYLKTHAKMCIVMKKTLEGKLKVYSHVGTGNYNEKTAKLYTDLSYLTSKRKIGIDLLNIFNILSGHSKPDESLSKISYSPVNLRKTLEKNIDREIHNVKNHKQGYIFIKVNSLSDNIINKLYKAADAGVKIEIVCRGICSIVPRKNLKVKSIVGRFLEHSRIYYFQNGKRPEYFISSADLLTRNLDRRVEVLINITDEDIKNQIEWFIQVYKADEANSFIENEKGKWKHSEGKFNSHEWFIEYSDERKKKKSWKK